MSSQDTANNATIVSTDGDSKTTTAASSFLHSIRTLFTAPSQTSLSGNTLPDPGPKQVITVVLYQKPTGSSESASPTPDQTLLDSKVLSRLSELFNGLKDASSIALEKSPLTIAWWKEESAGWTKPVFFLCLGRADLEKSVCHEKKQIDQGTFDMLSKGLHRGLEKWQVKRGQESWKMTTGSVESCNQLWGTENRWIELKTVICECEKQ